MMNLSDYRRTRDQLALDHYTARLPILKTEIAQLYAAIAPIWAEMREPYYRHASDAVKEKIYARMDDRDWTYQRLTAELAHIEAALPTIEARLRGEVVESVRTQPQGELFPV